MQTDNVQVTFKGATLGEVITHAKSFLSVAEQIAGAGAVSAGPARPVASSRKSTAQRAQEDIAAKEAAAVATAPSEMFGAEADETPADDFMTPPETAPAATTKKKLTETDVNNACIAYAKVHTKPKTLEILTKKFKVKSVLELKPDQYAEVIAALKV